MAVGISGAAIFGGICNNCTPTCTYRCIYKQMHYKKPFSHMKSLEIYENYITLFCSGKIKLFYNTLLTQNHVHGIFPK
jgi:hypothetical protein